MLKAQKIILGAVCLSLLGGLAWFTSVSGSEKKRVDTMDSVDAARPVPTAIMKEKPVEAVRYFPGSVTARQSVDLAFSVDGLLERLNGREGLRIKEGDLVAAIDERDFKHNYEAAEANFRNAETELKRSSSLKERKVISQSEYDKAKTQYDIAFSEFKIRTKALEDTKIYAPFDGVIAKRYVENREHIKKQTAVVALKNIQELDVVVQVPENLMGQGGLKPYSNIEVQFDVDKAHFYPAFIREYSVQASSVTRTYEVAVGFMNPEEIEILPGMTATVRVAFADSSQTESIPAMLVPVQSVFTDSSGESYVWIIPEDEGHPQKQRVELGQICRDEIEVFGPVRKGVRVATAGVHTLQEEMVVRPMVEKGEGLDG